MAAFRMIARVVVPLVCLGLRPNARADGPPPPPAAATKLKTQKVLVRVASDDGGARPEIELVQIPAGTIRLADADGKEHVHEVTPVWIARYETRWDEYDVFWQGLDLTSTERQQQRYHEAWTRSRTTPPYERPDTFGHDGFPASNVQFRAAVKYCAWLSKNTGKKFRLPTEAEWEYACRAGGPPLKPDGRGLGEVAWYLRNSADLPYGARPGTRFDLSYGHAHPVGQKKPNAWGLYDMLGNVGEFVVRDPKDDKGLLAGGSWKDEAKDVHSGAREPYSKKWIENDPVIPPNPDWLDYGSAHHVGFRVVMEE